MYLMRPNSGISAKAGPDGVIRDVTIRYEMPGYFNRVKNVVHHDRRGEVVFCVVRPDAGHHDQAR